MTNRLFYGDNLAVLRESIGDETVDLVYFDPPFSSNAGYLQYRELSDASTLFAWRARAAGA